MSDISEADKSSLRPEEEQEAGSTRRDFVVLAATAVACAGAATAAIPFIRSLSPDAGVLAVGSTEVDLSNIKQGETVAVMWRGAPVFITRRTAKEIQEAREVDIASLRDPETDEARVHKGKDEWLVTVGICTHLGCVPISHKGDYGGWFCPCHGSHYDTSGRIRRGPAPRNLAIPPYVFINDTKIKIG